jgi:hypothetical protein
MANKPLAGDHYPGLVRPHPPMPGVHPPTPGMHLLDLLTEPDEPAPSSPPGRDPVPMVLAGVAAAFATAALGVAILTWVSVSGLESVVAGGGQPTTAASASSAGGQEQVASGAQQPLGAPPAAPADGPPPGDPHGSNYSLAYPTQSLQLSLPPCKSSMVRYVDVDEPRVDADASRADVYYQARSGCYGTPQLNLIGAVTASVVTRSSLRPAQCVADIRNAPANTPILLSKAMNICVLTSADAAVGQDISQKVTLLEISDPNAGGSATVRITGWQVTP